MYAIGKKQPNTTTIRFVFFGLFAFALLLFPLITHAELTWQQTIANYVGNMILSTAALFTWLGGFMLDFAVLKLVVQMGAFIRGGLDIAIAEAWTTVRDVANIVFIFGFVYIGIRTIFDYESANTKRVLTSIIIGALLINFSLFFTKIVIDASNLLAVEIYNTTIAPSINNPSCPGCIAYSVLSRLGMSGLYTPHPDPSVFASLTEGGVLWFFILAAVFLLVAAFVFAAGAILLVIRFIALLLIMVFSPVLFAATVFPQTAGLARTLWVRLFAYSFFAPAYLFLIFVSLKIIDGSKALNPNNTQLGEGFSGNADFDMFGVIMVFVIAMILLILSLVIANKLGIVGGQQAIRIGNSLARGVGRGVRNVTWEPAKNVAAREASRFARKLDAIDYNPKKGHGAGRRVVAAVKKAPFITPALQSAGNLASGDIKKRTTEMGNYRNGQLKRRLATLGSTGGVTPLDRLAIYNTFRDRKDLDELDPEQLREYWDLLKRYEQGALPVNKLRADAAKIEDIEGKVALLKNSSDIRDLHKITVSITEKGEGGHEENHEERQEHVNEFVDSLIRQSNGDMLGALGRRQDEVTDAFFTRLKLHMDKKGYSTDDAEHVAKYFDDLEQEAVTRKNDARAARNRSAAKYFRTAPAARLFGMSESPAAKANKRSGPRSQTARSNDRGAGDEDGDPYDGIEEV